MLSAMTTRAPQANASAISRLAIRREYSRSSEVRHKRHRPMRQRRPALGLSKSYLRLKCRAGLQSAPSEGRGQPLRPWILGTLHL